MATTYLLTYLQVIDSLERLGLAHDGSRSHKIISQLHELFISGESFVTQEPSGQERDFTLDFKYTSADFEKASTFAAVPAICTHTRIYAHTCACIEKAALFAAVPVKKLPAPYAYIDTHTHMHAHTHAYTQVPDHKLPFDVIPEHQRPKHNYTCDPARKWRYFYVDGIFKAGTSHAWP